MTEDDSRVNPLEINGIGEVGFLGVNAAFASAKFHVTGTRERELSIRPEKLLWPVMPVAVAGNLQSSADTAVNDRMRLTA